MLPLVNNINLISTYSKTRYQIKATKKKSRDDFRVFGASVCSCHIWCQTSFHSKGNTSLWSVVYTHSGLGKGLCLVVCIENLTAILPLRRSAACWTFGVWCSSSAWHGSWARLELVGFAVSVQLMWISVLIHTTSMAFHHPVTVQHSHTARWHLQLKCQTQSHFPETIPSTDMAAQKGVNPWKLHECEECLICCSWAGMKNTNLFFTSETIYYGL